VNLNSKTCRFYGNMYLEMARLLLLVYELFLLHCNMINKFHLKQCGGNICSSESLKQFHVRRASKC